MRLKKLLAIVLCVAMILSTMGTVAFAEETYVTATDITDETALDYAVRFDVAQLVDSYTSTTNPWKVDVFFTSNKNLTLDSRDDSADGYLSVLLPSLSSMFGWRNLPAGSAFNPTNCLVDAAVVEAGTPFKVMEYFYNDLGLGNTKGLNYYELETGLSCGLKLNKDFDDFSGEISLVIYQLEGGKEKNHTTLASYTFGEEPEDDDTPVVGGSGTEEDPILINTAEDLATLRDNVNNGDNYAGKYVKLNDDIDLSSVDNWTPIGDTTYNSKYAPVNPAVVFSGVFDGNNKVISNLKIERALGEGPDADANIGLFGIIGEGAVIKDLTITNVDIDTDGRNVGALAGVAHKTTLDNITVNGDIQISGGNNVCGVCAMTRYYEMSATNIAVSGADGSAITGNNIVGGIFAEIAPNGSTQTFENLSVENVAITGVGGVGGIVGLLTNGSVSDVSVKNVALVGKTEYQGDPMGRIRLGSIVGLLGSTHATISNVTVQNVTAKNLAGEDVVLPVIGANYDASSNATEAKIGDTYYATLEAAVDAAQAGDAVSVFVKIADTAVSVNKNLTITGPVSANNVTINAVEGCDELTVSGFTFTGNSWINSGAAGKLTVSGVTANVTPSNTSYTNSRSAFISLGRNEGKELELVVENSNIAPASGSNPILGWAQITSATITGNTFGSSTAYQNSGDSIKFMGIADGATITIKGNTLYSNYNGIVFGQNTTRDNAYTAVIEDNDFHGEADHVWVEVSGSNTVKATILATSDNTINGNAFTANDIKVHPNIQIWTSYAGVDIVTDENGKVIGGQLAFSANDAIAEGYEKDENGNVVVVIPDVAEVNGTGYTTLQEALNAAAAGEGDVTVEILENINLTNVDWNPVTVSAPKYPVVTVNGNSKTITGLNDMLFAGTWAGGSGLIINDLTIADSAIVNDKDDEKGTVGVGAFIGFPQASATVTLNNCHLVNSSVEGGHWTGGLIGYAAGYAGTDGPVFMNLTINECSVTGSTITGKGSAGGIIGHATGNAWTQVTITDTTVSGNTVTSTGSSTNKAGAVIGTIGAAGQATTVNGVEKTGGVSVAATVSSNTVKSAGATITTIYGRQGTDTGMLYVAGGEYDNYPIEENVAYAAPVEGYEIVENDNGTFGIQVAPSYVAEVNGVEYETFAEAAAAAKASDEIVLLANVEGNIDVPANVTFNGNGFAVNGTFNALGDITFAGHTKMTAFDFAYTDTTFNIGAGACLEITGTGRMVIGHGCTFNITGSVADAKTADIASITPSLIAPGASFTGAGVNFNVTNAYVKFTAYCSSKNSNANNTFNFDITNSIWDQTGSLVFSEPTSGKDPTFNFNLKDSVLNSTSHLVFAVTKGDIVIDNSNVNVGVYRQLENRSNLTIKNGSIVYAAHATSSNAKNPGTTTVENSTYNATGEYTGSDVGIGTLVVKQGAIVSMGKITKANIVVDATNMAAGDVVGITADLSKLAGTLSVINNNLEAKVVDGKIVLAAAPVAKIGEQGYATLADAIAAAEDGDVIEIIAEELIFADASSITIDKAITIKGAGKDATTLKFDSAASAFSIASSNVTFSDMTITQGAKDNSFHISIPKGAWNAPAIQYSDITIRNIKFVGSDYALCLIGENVTVDSCEFTDQDSHNIIIYSLKGDSKITNNIFNASRGNNKSAILYEGGADNATDLSGFIGGGTLTVEGNEAYSKGVFFQFTNWKLVEDMSVTITGNEIDAFTNKAIALYDLDGAVTAEGNEFASFVINENIFTNVPAGRSVLKEYTGTVEVDASANYLGSEAPDYGALLVGEKVKVQSYYSDAALTNLVTLTTATIVAQNMDANGNVVGEYTDFESALAAACADASVSRIEVLGDITHEVQTPDGLYAIAENQNLTIGVPAGAEYTVDITRNGETFSIYMMTSNSSLTIGEGLTIKGLEVVANGFWTANNKLVVDGTLYALSLKEWTSNNGITISETGKVVLGYGDGQFDFNYGNGTVTVIGNGDKTEAQVVAGYTTTQGNSNGSTLNLKDTYFESGAWLTVGGSNGTFNVDNSILKVSGGDFAGDVTVSNSGNTFNLTNGAELVAGNLVLGAGNALNIDGTSQVKVTTLKGAGTITLDASDMTADSTPVVGNASAFTGSIVVVNNDSLVAEIDENGNIVLVAVATPSVAEINGVGFATLEEAFTAAAEGDTIVLVSDIELSKAVSITKSITLDGGNHKITPAADFVADGNSAAIVFANGKTAYDSNLNCAVKNATFEGFNGLERIVRANFCNATIENCTFVNNNVTSGVITSSYAELDVKDCEFNSNTSGFAIINNGFDVSNGTTLVADITGSTFTGNSAAIAVIYAANSANVTSNEFSGNIHTGTNANAAAILVGPYSGSISYTINVNENAFVNAMSKGETALPAVFAEDWSEQYSSTTAFDLSSNYWDGNSPADGYATSGANPDVTVEDYYTTYVDGELGGLVEIATPAATPFKDAPLFIAGLPDDTDDNGVKYHPVYIATSVDSLDYQTVGFDYSLQILNPETNEYDSVPFTTETDEVYTSISDATKTYTVADIGGNGAYLFMNKLWFHADYYHNDNTKFFITPYAIDLDGNKITGWTLEMTNDIYKSWQTGDVKVDMFKEVN